MALQIQSPPKCAKSCSECLAWIRAPEKKVEIETICKRVRTSVFYQQILLAEDAKKEKEAGAKKEVGVQLRVEPLEVPKFFRNLLDANHIAPVMDRKPATVPAE